MAHNNTPAKYLSDLQLANRFGVSRCTIWRWVRDRGMPQPVRLSPGCTRWKIAEIERWEQEAAA